MSIAYIAAHAGFPLDRVPLGGGASIADHLIKEWQTSRPFDLQVISPEILGRYAPKEFDLVRMSEWAYARFCLVFERDATRAVKNSRRRPTAVLCNDVSEGPDFKQLSEAGYSLYTIYHVDVLDYVCRMYLRGIITPPRLAAMYRGLERSGFHSWVPDIVQLVLRKQEHSVRYSRGLIVPSRAMKGVLLSCYPATDPARIHVLPWGMWDAAPVSDKVVEAERNTLKSVWSDLPKPFVLLTLSRISPEKGQDRLLEALALWEKRPDFPSEGLVCLIAGEAAYMQGQRFKKRLQTLAARLKRTRVVFPGYASGARKEALWRLADLYVFASRHESYGLTMLEAMRSGLPVLCTSTHGAREIFQPEVGYMTADADGVQVPEQLLEGLKMLLADSAKFQERKKNARHLGNSRSFSKAAVELASLLSRE